MSLAVLPLFLGLAFAQDAPPPPAAEPAAEATPAEAPEPAADPNAPAKGSPEEAIRESLLLMKAGETAKWMDTWCVPAKCKDEASRQELEAYMLKQATKTAGNCLHGDEGSIQVTSVKGDPATDSKLSIRLACTHTKYPPPAVVEKVDGKWYVSAIPW